LKINFSEIVISMPKLKKVYLYDNENTDGGDVVEFLQKAIGANKYQVEQILLICYLNKKAFISSYNKRYKDNIINLKALIGKLDLRIE